MHTLYNTNKCVSIIFTITVHKIYKEEMMKYNAIN